MKIEKLIESTEDSKTEQTEKTEQIEFKKFIDIDDLLKIEIRVGKVLDVEDVADSDKLYKLLVDFSEEKPRVIVSGIKKDWEKEFLLNKQFVFITNLLPRKIMGLESQAMILATGEESLVLLSPTNQVKNGSRMK